MILNIKKHYKLILCFVFVLLSALYSFYTPSYAFSESAFKVSGRLYPGSSGSEQLQIVPLTTDTVYYISLDEDNLAYIDIYCNVDTGNGYFSSNRYGAYYLSSNTTINCSLTVYYQISDTINFNPIINSTTTNPDVPTFRFSLAFSDSTQSNVFANTYVYVSPPEVIPDSVSSVKQNISVAMNIKDLYPNKFIRNCTVRLQFPNLLTEGASFIRVHFNSFELGDYSISRGNLDQLISADSQANAMMQEVQGMNGIGGVPSVDPLDLVQGSGDFMRWSSHVYNIPVISSMVALTISFSLLFFLLKKR